MSANTLALTTEESGWVDRLVSHQGFSPEYQELKFTLHRKLLDRINLEMLSSVAVERVRSEVRSAVAKLVDEEKTPLSLVEKDRIIGEVLDEVFGLGPLEPLLADPTISDILVTTPRLVYIERAGKLYKTPVQFKDNAHLMRIIEKIVARVGRRVDESSPLVDARLPDGSRVNAAIPPVAVDGPLHNTITDRAIEVGFHSIDYDQPAPRRASFQKPVFWLPKKPALIVTCSRSRRVPSRS